MDFRPLKCSRTYVIPTYIQINFSKWNEIEFCYGNVKCAAGSNRRAYYYAEHTLSQ